MRPPSTAVLPVQLQRILDGRYLGALKALRRRVARVQAELRDAKAQLKDLKGELRRMRSAADASTVPIKLQAPTGQEIQAFRIKSGLTQDALAAQLGVDHSVVSLWESGKRTPSRQPLLEKLYHLMAKAPVYRTPATRRKGAAPAAPIGQGTIELGTSPLPARHAAPIKHIRRYGRDGALGWTVLVTRQGKRHERAFPDRGDQDAALRDAKVWRDHLLARLPAPTRSRVTHKQALNRTGMIGVYLEPADASSGSRDASQARYCATWTDEKAGRMRKRCFAVSKYGKAEAFELACDARRKGIAPLVKPKPSRA